MSNPMIGTGSPTYEPPRYWAWLAAAAAGLCVASIVVTTLLIPRPSDIPVGGFVPISQPGR